MLDDEEQFPGNRKDPTPTSPESSASSSTAAAKQSDSEKIPSAISGPITDADLGKPPGYGKRKLVMIAAGILILVAIVAVVVVLLSSNTHAPPAQTSVISVSTSALTTSIPASSNSYQNQINITRVNSLVSSFSPNITVQNSTTTGPVKNVLNSNVTSFTNTYATQSLQNGNVMDYSSLNKSEPLAIYLTIYYINYTDMKNFTEKFNSDDGYGSQYPYGVIKSNSSFSAVPTNFNGASGLVDELSNFTPNGLNLSGVYYVGAQPDINWYFTAVIYKNVRIGVGEWGFAGHMKTGWLINYTDRVIAGLSENSTG